MANSRKNCIELPATKGIQAGKPYYIAMCPLYLAVKLFTYTDQSLPSDMRAQRILNKQRIPEMKDYILKNRDSYVFSALTVSVDGDLEFIPTKKIAYSGTLRISIDSRVVINDGQHRRAAIEAALRECPELRYEDISVVIYHDLGLIRSQQIFTDLNRYAVRPTKSLNILYDNRDAFSILLKDCIQEIPIFNGNTENEKSSISNRSKALFTLSALFHATKILFRGKKWSEKEMYNIVVQFWNAVASNMPIWQKTANKVLSPEEFRKSYISGHAITLKAIGNIGNYLLMNDFEKINWADSLSFLKEINWSKSNPEFKNLIIMNGKISPSHSNQRAFTQYLLEKSKIIK